MVIRRGELTSPDDRRKALEVPDDADFAGARPREVASLLGVGLTTLQCWRRQLAGGGNGTDRRNGIRVTLTDASPTRNTK